MQARILFLISILFWGIGHSATLKYTHLNPITRHYPIAAYTAVNITGKINLSLHTGYRKPQLMLSADPRDLDNIQISVIQGVLSLSLRNPKIQYGPITADIRSHYLNGLVYHGSGRIVGERLRANFERLIIDNPGQTVLRGTIWIGRMTLLGNGNAEIEGVTGPRLSVTMAGDSKLRLKGFVALRQLNMKGRSTFSLSWVKSPSLNICASDKATIELAGIVNKLDVELWKTAQLNAQYLRARRAFVKTHDDSIAKIAVTQHQSTLAMDASDIQFFNLPMMKTDLMAYDGAVLDMRRFDTADVKALTPYNN